MSQTLFSVVVETAIEVCWSG